jgi:hypothetical protein
MATDFTNMAVDAVLKSDVPPSGIYTYKEFAVLIPLLGSGLAVAYDVGYFGGLDIEFFSFFSLSEHIVFALRAFPPAVVVACLIGAAMPFQSRYLDDLRQLERRKKLGLISICALAMLLLWGAAAALSGAGVINLGDMAAFLTVILIMLAIMLDRLVTRTLVVCAAVTIVSFAAGYESAKNILAPKPHVRFVQFTGTTVIDTARDGALEVRLIRSGDRGVLFFDLKSRQVTFIRWDEIKKIRATTLSN